MSTTLDTFLARALDLMDQIEAILPGQILEPDWDASIAFKYRKRSSGRGILQPIRQVSKFRLDDLKEVDGQKERLVRNTEQFVNGKLANNVLLTGSRGSGKSSLIKACLNAYAHRKLRLIEVDKSDLTDLPDLVECLSQRPEKFIIFADDLSFDEGEKGYKELKSILDGSINATGSNVLIYATSNRRHLLPEYISDNASYQHTQDGELHPGEVVEEKISLSERFGLWLSFYPFSQEEYLNIVSQWLHHFGIGQHDIDEAKPHALVWALERGSRSGRIAYQFARDYAGRAGVDAV